MDQALWQQNRGWAIPQIWKSCSKGEKETDIKDEQIIYPANLHTSWTLVSIYARVFDISESLKMSQN